MALKPITRQEQIIAGKDLEPITRMERFLKQYGGGASSWNDLKDKPFGEEQAFEPIVWDGNKEGLKSVDLGGAIILKISDQVIPITDDVNPIHSITYASTEYGGEPQTNCPVIMERAGVDGMWTDNLNTVFVVTKMNEQLEELGFSVGVWIQDVFITYEIHPKSTIKPLDEKYLPTLTSPSGKKFKLSVDDSGTISATEV